MAFPRSSPSSIHVEIFVRGAWVDITSDVVGEGVSAININRHAKERGPGTANNSPCTATMSIATADGKYSPRNATGPYYGYLGNNTPVRIYLTPHYSSGFGMDDADSFTRSVSSGWGSSEGGNAYSVWYYGGAYSASNWSVNGTQGVQSIPAALAYRVAGLSALSLTDVDIYVTADTTVTSVTGGSIEIGGVYARLNTTTWDGYLARVDIDTSGTCTAKIFAGGYSIASSVVSAITWTSQPLCTRFRIIGNQLAYKVWDAATTEPTDWTIEVVSDTYTQPGIVAFRSGVASGNTNTKPVVCTFDDMAITAIYPRFTGEISSWPVKWSATGLNARTTVTAAGPLRRLNLGVRAIRGALSRRYIELDPLAYWPLDDGSDTSLGGSALATDQPGFHLENVADFKQLDGPAGATAKLPQFAINTKRLASFGPALSVRLNGSTGTLYTVDFIYLAERTDASTYVEYYPIVWKDDNGNEFRVAVYLDWSSTTINYIKVTAYSPNYASSAAAQLDINTTEGNWHHVRIEVQPTQMLLLLDDTYTATVSISAVVTVASMRQIDLWNNYKQFMDNASCAHVGVFRGVYLATTYDAFLGYQGEDIGTRLARLASDDNISITFDDGGDTRTLSAQRQVKLPELLADINSADLGQMAEQRGSFGLKYISNSYMQNRTPLVLTYTDGVITDTNVFAPAVDDAMRWNDVTTQRYNGAKVRIEVANGPNSTQDPPNGIGVYDRGVFTTHVGTDSEVNAIANYLAMAGTRHENRWPAVPVNLGRNVFALDHTLSAAIANIDVGSALRLTDLPIFVGDSTSDVLVVGYTEVIANTRWELTFVTSPYEPYIVPLVDADSRISTDGDIQLLVPISNTATSCLIGSITASQRWGQTTDPNPAITFPLEALIGREIVTVTACSELATDTCARTVASGWGTADTGQSWVAVSGSAAYSVANPYGIIQPTSNGVQCPVVLTLDGCNDMHLQSDIRIPVLSATGTLRGGVVARYADPNNYYYAAGMFANSGTVTLRIGKVTSGTSYSISDYAVPWTYTAGDIWRIKFAVCDTILRAKLWRVNYSEPAHWQLEIYDTALSSGAYGGCIARNDGSTTTQTIQLTNFKTISPQKLTITRGGLAIAHAAYAGVDVLDPIYLGF